jgi:hypothetical protein
MTLWKPRRCCRCRQTIHRLYGSMAEMCQDGGHPGVWHYHYGCWYACLKEQGAQWLEPFAAATDMPPVARLHPEAAAPAVQGGS